MAAFIDDSKAKDNNIYKRLKQQRLDRIQQNEQIELRCDTKNSSSPRWLSTKWQSERERLRKDALRLEQLEKEVERDRRLRNKMMEDIRREKEALDREKQEFAAKKAAMESLKNDIIEERQKFMEEFERNKRKEDDRRVRDKAMNEQNKRNKIKGNQQLQKVIKQERDELDRERDKLQHERVVLASERRQHLESVNEERRKLKIQSKEMEETHYKLMEQAQREIDNTLKMKEKNSEMRLKMKEKDSEMRRKFRKEAERLKQIQQDLADERKAFEYQRAAMEADVKERREIRWKHKMDSLRWKSIRSDAKRMRDELKLEKEEFRKSAKIKEAELARQGIKQQKSARKERISQLELERLKREVTKLKRLNMELNNDRSRKSRASFEAVPKRNM